MVELSFPYLVFTEDNDIICVTYATYYEFSLPRLMFTNIDQDVSFQGNTIALPNTSQASAEHKLKRLIDKGLHNLIRKSNKRKVLYIDARSDIPLIGSNEFGVVDRNTNILEVKPLTGCNLNCIYCSVGEGKNNKLLDVLIDPDYLVEVCSSLALKKSHPVEFNIGPHAEPLLYPFLQELVVGLRQIPNCAVISINTNGTLLSKKKIADLKEAGLSRINLSLNTLDEELNNTLSGQPYPTRHVLSMIKYCQEVSLPVLLAPLIVPGYNDTPVHIEPLVKLATTIRSPFPTLGFQKFLRYKGGRNPVKKEQSFEEFFSLLEPFEERYNIILTPKQDYNPFRIFEEKTLEKPFVKNDIVRARIIGTGRVPSERLCTAQNRLITARGLHKGSGTVTLKIVRDKHNVFLGVAV